MKKNYQWSMLAMIVVLLGGISLTACGDDEEETVVPILRGAFRTPYVRKIGLYSEGSAGVGTTGHTFTCTSMHVYSFNDDLNVYSVDIHSNKCVREHKWMGDDAWETMLDENNDTLDWSAKTSPLTYKLDTKQHTVTISDGNTYFLELDSSGRFYNKLKDEHGGTQYVLGSVTDENYNKVDYFSWLANLYGSN